MECCVIAVEDVCVITGGGQKLYDLFHTHGATLFIYQGLYQKNLNSLRNAGD